MKVLEKVCEIIQTQMQLDSGQIFIYNQKIIIPPDDRMYVVVGVLSCKPFSSSRRAVAEAASMSDVQAMNWYAQLSIDVMGRSFSALDRKEEVIMALQSAYSLQVQAAESIMIAPIPSGFTNISGVDGSAIPFRFNATVAVQYLATKSQRVEYYDDFSKGYEMETES